MSLHTKYRPLSFDEVLGQETTIKSLKEVIKSKRSHSYIFTGPSGTGKTTLARILANEFAGGQATAANVEEIDAATNSGADAMRDIVNRSLYRAIGSSGVKSIILDEAHRLSAAAWTILLKPIEEPPQHVYWMLCTTEPGKIPKTIQTRCLKYDLKPVGEELINELLQSVAEVEGFDTPDEVVAAISEDAGGSPRQALVWLEACTHAKSPQEARTIIRSATQSREAVDLARWLLTGRGQSWAEAVRLVKALEGTDPESIRIMIVNYLASVLLNTNGDDKARQVLALMEPFRASYNASDRLAPLLYSIAMAINLDYPTMRELPVVFYIVAIVFTIIIIWVVVYFFALREGPKHTYEPPALTDWRTTGVADFIGSDAVMLSEQDNIPAQFVLRIQEQRQIANIAGTPMTEYRWRLATKAEAKDIVQTVAIYRKGQ